MCNRNNETYNENNGCARHGRHGCRGPRGRFDRAEWEAKYLAMDADEKLGVLMHELHHMSRFFFESRGGQHRILCILAQEGDMTQRALTERLGVRPGSASELMGKLERAGLIARTESAEDRRTADVRLTEAGRAALSEGKREKPDLFSALSDKEKDELIVLLEKLRGSWREKLHEERAGHECCHKHGRCHEPADDSKAD